MIAFPSETSFLASSTLIRATSLSGDCPSFVVAPPGLGVPLAEAVASDEPFELEQANARQAVMATNTRRKVREFFFIYLSRSLSEEGLRNKRKFLVCFVIFVYFVIPFTPII